MSNKALALHYLQKDNIAIKVIDEALQNNRQYAYAWYVKGRILIGLKKYDEAIESFKKAITIQPNLADAHYYLIEIAKDARRMNWWDFWTSSKTKKGVLVGLAIAAFFSLAYPLLFDNNIIIELYNDRVLLMIPCKTYKSSIKVTKEYKIELFIVIYGSILFIIFHTEIRKINVDPIGIETEPSRVEGEASGSGRLNI